jgi:hypothetical protein
MMYKFTGKCTRILWDKCMSHTGGSDRETEGHFVWNTGAEMTFTYFLPPEPNSYTAEDDCIIVTYPGGSWADFGCNNELSYVCEKTS